MTSQSPVAPGFRALGLTPEVQRAVDEMGYQEPTSVQQAVFAPALQGKDLVVQARTGTGKTSAFGLPMISKLIRTSETSVQVLVLCPTRELALQVSQELSSLAQYNGVKTLAVYGGAPMQKQISALEQGAHIVIGTPGRVLDHLRRKTLDPSHIKQLVLDESDEMLSMGFLPQITDIWEQLPDKLQVLLFSATVPREVLRIAESRLHDPEFITLSGDQIGALEISHFFYHSHGNKLDELMVLLDIENPESAIVFCNTKDETKRVSAALNARGFKADWLNADLSQSERENVMRQTRESQLRFLVCTDVAARGIDISHLTHVINFDFPESTDQYVHRTGRTGRAGRMGTAISLVAPGSIGDLYYLKLRYKIDPIERELPAPSEVKTREETDALHQIRRMLPSADPLSTRLAARVLASDDAEALVAQLIAAQVAQEPTLQTRAVKLRRQSVPERQPSKTDERKRAARPARSPRDDAAADRQRARPTSTGSSNGKSARQRSPRGARVEYRELDGIGYSVSDPPEMDSPTRQPPATQKSAPHPGANSMDDSPAARSRAQRDTDVTDARLADDASGDSSSEDLAEVYVNVGKRDGATDEDFVEALKGAGVQLSEQSYINVRQRHTFLGVPDELIDSVIAGLDGTEIASRRASAERARSSKA